MKTHKKLVSILCAVALLVSALPATSAVSAEPLSEYAGKTISVQVVEETERAPISRIIEVAIPEGATLEEANALVRAASCPGGVSTFSMNQQTYGLSYIRGLMFNSEERRAGYGTLPSGQILYVTAEFDLNTNLIPSNAQLLVQYRNETLGTVNNPWKSIDIVNGVDKVLFYSHEYTLREGYNISIYAKSSSPTENIFTNYCMVTATVY